MRLRLSSSTLPFALSCLVVLLGCQPIAQQDSTETAEQATAQAGQTTDSESSSQESSAATEEAAAAPALVAVTLPAQTVLLVEMASGLSSHTSQPGQAFRATVAQEVSMNGLLAVPVGSSVYGKVAEAHPADKIGGRAKLALIFHTLERPGGEPVAIATNFDLAGKSQRAKDAAMIGGGVVGGAIIGDQIDDGTGTAIGAIIGGVAGTVAAKKTKGKPVELPAGTMLTLTLTQPLTVQVPT
jgi:hypothetical protein